jgi:hypothetical protein
MKTLLISCVLAVTSCLTNGASADATPPQEITKHFAPQGQIVQYVELQSEAGPVYVGVVQFGEYYLIAYIYWMKSRWHFDDKDLLEIFVVENNVPTTIWRRTP